MNLKKNALCLVAATSISLLAGSVWAQDAKGGSALLSAVNGSHSIQSFSAPAEPLAIPPDCLSFDGLSSWDGLDDTDNIVIDLDIGPGNTLTGVGWDIGIATIGASWLSEATIQHSDSTGSADPNAINLNIGATLDNSGDQDFSSGGTIVDFSDNMLPEITAGPDGILRLQLFESFDDNADAIDADYRNAAAPQLCAGLALACTNQFACN
ncbi:MAG: hypothetical protein ACPGJE_09615, partial [Wenzhouxiangellaceae bacterium]